MVWLLISALLAIIFVLWRRMLHMRRLLHELDTAVRARRRLLPEDSAQTLRKIGTLQLVDSINELVESHNTTSAQTQGYSTQVETMLDAVQEVIIVFNTDRIIEYANRSAQNLLRGGQSIKGLRLEGVLRSLTLLQLLEAASESPQTLPTQINIEKGGEKRWFEASCAQVEGRGVGTSGSMLLVLHDITQLKSLEVMRKEFVANVSHELRTPLTIIKGFAETLIDDAATIDEQARLRFTGKILNNAERLHVLVEDLLTLSRLESRPDQIEVFEQAFAPLIEEVAENYRSRLKAESQRIDISVDEAIGAIAFDRYKIHQVLDNFVENVFRYAPEFTRLSIEARLEPEEAQMRCSVIDDGPGIPEKDLPHIFERFYRVDKGRSRDTGGTGLGLSIVKHIIQLHGGNVHAESRVGEGTRMSFTLPVKRCPAERGAQESVRLT
jgi:signal transduction histidine kinase